MIGRLSGILLEKQAPDLLVDVNGVGYLVSAPLSSFVQLPEPGEAVLLHTHMIVREDAQLLYGFVSQDERRLFRTLIKASGVGPKLALTILSGLEVEGLVRIIREADVKSLTRLPGVGKKTAERLVVELKDSFKEWSLASTTADTQATPSAGTPANSALDEAEAALITLGYKPQEAAKSLAAVVQPGLSSEELIRLALKSIFQASNQR